MENRKWHLSVPTWRIVYQEILHWVFMSMMKVIWADRMRCDQCNMVLDKAETEDELDEWFTSCDHKIICVNCWDEVKIQNINTSDE